MTIVDLCADFERHHKLFGKHSNGIILIREKKREVVVDKLKENLTSVMGWTFSSVQKTFSHDNGAKLRICTFDTASDFRKYWASEYAWLGILELDELTPDEFGALMYLKSARLRSAHGVLCRFVASVSDIASPMGPLHV